MRREVLAGVVASVTEMPRHFHALNGDDGIAAPTDAEVFTILVRIFDVND
jgi:hypothetical protein